MNDQNNDKELKEWQLNNLSKLKVESSGFAKGELPKWNKIIASIPSKSNNDEANDESYKKLWIDAWEKSCAMVKNAKDKSMCSSINWYLDKQRELRQELCDYVKVDVPAIIEALCGDKSGEKDSCISDLHELDDLWRSSWKDTLNLATMDE